MNRTTTYLSPLRLRHFSGAAALIAGVTALAACSASTGASGPECGPEATFATEAGPEDTVAQGADGVDYSTLGDTRLMYEADGVGIFLVGSMDGVGPCVWTESGGEFVIAGCGSPTVEMMSGDAPSVTYDATGNVEQHISSSYEAVNDCLAFVK